MKEVDVPKLLATVKTLTEKVKFLEKVTADLEKRVTEIEQCRESPEDEDHEEEED